MRRCWSAVVFPVALIGGLLVPGAVSNGRHGVTFLFPTGGETFTFPHTIVNVSYITPFSAPQLFIFCGSFGGRVRHVRTEFVKPFSNFQLTPINFTNSDKCWFNLRPNASAGYGDNTGGFFIVADESAKPTTIGLATATGPTPAPDTAPSVQPDAAAQSSQQGLSSGAVAGISVGATLVTAILCAAALAFWWAARNHPRTGGSSQSRWTTLTGFGQKPAGADSEEKPFAAPTAGPGPWQTTNSLSNASSHASGHPQGPSASDGYYGAHASVAPASGRAGDAHSVSTTYKTASDVGTSPSSYSAVVVAPAAPVASIPATADCEPAELPSIDIYRGWGGEQEMPVSGTAASRQPHPGHGPDGAEQKFLLREVQAFKTQRPSPNPSDPGPGPYFAG